MGKGLSYSFRLLLLYSLLRPVSQKRIKVVTPAFSRLSSVSTSVFWHPLHDDIFFFLHLEILMDSLRPKEGIYGVLYCV